MSYQYSKLCGEGWSRASGSVRRKVEYSAFHHIKRTIRLIHDQSPQFLAYIVIRHILLFSFAAHANEEQEHELLAELRLLPLQFPHIRQFALGPNISRRDDTFAYGMTMTFADAADMESYLTSEFHESFVADRFRPLIERRAIVSFVSD